MAVNSLVIYTGQRRVFQTCQAAGRNIGAARRVGPCHVCLVEAPGLEKGQEGQSHQGTLEQALGVLGALMRTRQGPGPRETGDRKSVV